MTLEGVGANFQFCQYYGGNAQPQNALGAEAMGILGAGSGGKGSAEGVSFQPVQQNFIVLTLPILFTRSRACLSLSLSFSLCVRACMCVMCDYVSGVSLQSK